MVGDEEMRYLEHTINVVMAAILPSHMRYVMIVVSLHGATPLLVAPGIDNKNGIDALRRAMEELQKGVRP